MDLNNSVLYIKARAAGKTRLKHVTQASSRLLLESGAGGVTSSPCRDNEGFNSKVGVHGCRI